MQGANDNQGNLNNNKAGEYTLIVIKIYYKTIVIRTV